MEPIQILHLGDLNLTEDSAARTSKRLEREVQNLNFDYILISGGITCDGKVSSFKAASEVLTELTGLMHSQGADPKRRLLIVPGRNDFDPRSNGKSLSHFEHFYHKFFDDSKEL